MTAHRPQTTIDKDAFAAEEALVNPLDRSRNAARRLETPRVAAMFRQ